MSVTEAMKAITDCTKKLVEDLSQEEFAEEWAKADINKMFNDVLKKKMGDRCGDNRFEVIEKAKKELLFNTNIDTAKDEMKVIDSFLFRCWQMGWLERYDKPREPLDIPTMTTEFVKEHGLPCPNGYIFKDENGNVINATKIVLEKKKGLTQERINTIVHKSCILFCEHCGCGVPRDTCISLSTCEEYDDYRKHIRTYLENYGNTDKERLA